MRLQNGTVEAAHTAPYYFFGKDETFALDCAVPFGLNSRQQAAWMFEGNGMALMREFYKQYNIVNFSMGNNRRADGGWYRKELHTVDDIKGLKMRIGGFGGKVLAGIGGDTAEPAGRRHLSGARERQDRRSRVGRSLRRRETGLQQIAKFYYYPGWWEGGPQLTLFVNNKAF